MKILLTGGTGFVGEEIAGQLRAAGHSLRFLVRNPRGHEDKSTAEGVELFHGNILHGPSLAGCLEGIDAVVHLVGIITELDEQTFERVHHQGTVNLLAEAKKAKLKRWIQMSALGVRAGARSRYHRSKWAAEEAVRASSLDWTIFRPSIIYGRHDKFVNLFAGMMRFPMSVLQLFSIPVFGGGFSRLQPIPVEDVARAFTGALGRPVSIKKTYDLCGPDPIQFRDLLSEIASALGQKASLMPWFGRRRLGDWANFLIPLTFAMSILRPKPLLVPVPWDAASFLAWAMEAVAQRPPLNRDQLLMLEEDNVGDPTEAAQDLGIQSPCFGEGIARYLRPLS